MKTVLAALIAASTFAAVIPANAGFGPKDLQTFEGPGFGPADIKSFEGPAFGPADIKSFEGPAFGPKDLQTFEGPGLSSSNDAGMTR